MKKIIRLTIPFIILAVLFVFSSAQAARVAESTTNTTGQGEKPEQAGPPWYDQAWHYRSEVIISNEGDLLSYYQVLVRLDESNFNFDLAELDGSDVRFTHSDGTTELKFWIESWDNLEQLAYVWVRVPSLATGNTNIYLYYNNPDANPASDGASTFDGFEDDWSEFTSGGYHQGEIAQTDQTPEGIYSPFTWSVISGSPEASAGILSLADGDGIRSNSTYQYNAVGMQANFGSGNGYERAGFLNISTEQQTMIGDLPSDANNLYLIDKRSAFEYILLPRDNGEDWHNVYHIYEVRWNSDQCIGDIDHGLSTVGSSLPSQVPNIYLPVTLYSFQGSNATLMVDWVYVRQYRYPEPSISLGSEQGLVDLAISQEDFPDPVYAGEALTYQLTINNNSDLDAPSVVVTDTLPGQSLFALAESSQGNCTLENSLVLCNLETMNAQSSASITVVVTTTIDGLITNLTTVGSPGYDYNMGNNFADATTTVIPSADLVIAIEGDPEVLLPGEMLTYSIIVSNQGPSVATGVNMTDTLPSEVEFIGTSPDICEIIGLQVSCPLGDLDQAESKSIIITANVEVSETIELINSASTNSMNVHDPDINNNSSEITTLVDTTPPDIDWVKPTQNGEIYHTTGGFVILEALPIDNDQIDRVEYWWYDPASGYQFIDEVSDPPYQSSFYVNVLDTGIEYFFEVRAYDRVGNSNFPDHRRYIYIERINSIYIPVVSK